MVEVVLFMPYHSWLARESGNAADMQSRYSHAGENIQNKLDILHTHHTAIVPETAKQIQTQTKENIRYNYRNND